MAEAELPRGTLGTVRNAATLLDLLSDGPAFQQLSDLAERSGLSLPTVHRLLRSLVAAGLVEQDPASSRYSLGSELVRLSERYLDRAWPNERWTRGCYGCFMPPGAWVENGPALRAPIGIVTTLRTETRLGRERVAGASSRSTDRRDRRRCGIRVPH